jgi:soluble lytic murein transglycosylase-like protein
MATAELTIANVPHELGSSPGEQCRAAIEQAERLHGIPVHLLAAIGQVESGRLDQESQQWMPWPWTIDVGGTGRFFANKENAIAAMYDLQAKGVRSIDVGCVQINLAQHPNAFRTLEDAFDPERNARYGAGLLARLFAMTKDWRRAAGFYHSATPALGAVYEHKVMAVSFDRNGRIPAFKPNPPMLLLRTPEQQLAAA